MENFIFCASKGLNITTRHWKSHDFLENINQPGINKSPTNNQTIK